MKKVDLRKIAKIAPNLGFFELVEIFALFGIELKFEFTKRKYSARIIKKSKA